MQQRHQALNDLVRPVSWKNRGATGKHAAMKPMKSSGIVHIPTTAILYVMFSVWSNFMAVTRRIVVPKQALVFVRTVNKI
jgi:hypothetical protein